MKLFRLALAFSCACGGAAPPAPTPPPPAHAEPARPLSASQRRADTDKLLARALLPHAEDATFHRLVDRASLPSDLDMPTLMDAMRDEKKLLVAYVDANKSGGAYYAEVAAVASLTVHTASRSLAVADDFIAKLPPDDAKRAVRLAGRDGIRAGAGETLLGAILILGEPSADARVRTVFADALAADVAPIWRFCAPRDRHALAQTLDRVEKSAPSPELGAAVARLRRALVPAADVVVTPASITGFGATIAIEDASHGAPPSAKREGNPHDLMIVPLGDAAAKRRPAMPVIVDVDPRAPYRELVEVLFTLGQNEITAYDIRPTDARERGFVSFPPRAIAARRPDDLGLTAIIVADGVSLKGRGGNVAPGCEETGPGLAIARRDRGIDVEALRVCLDKLKAIAPAAREATVSANPNVPFADVLAVVEALRGEALERFPDITFGVAR